MSPILAELLGTAVLVMLGDGVVANVVLQRTKGNNSGWIVITAGWALAVTIAVYCVNSISGAHLNPAVTIALASIGSFPWANVPGYIVAQIAGAFLGAVIVWLAYLPHWKATPDPASKLARLLHGTGHPANGAQPDHGDHRHVRAGARRFSPCSRPGNFVPGSDLAKGFGPVLVGVIVMAIGLSLGGPTGYAINPARDLGPRIAHAMLPIAGKGASDWGYAWIPIVGPIIGGVLGALHISSLMWNA